MELFLIIKYMTIISFSVITVILLVALFIFIAKRKKSDESNLFYENLNIEQNKNIKTNIHFNSTPHNELFKASNHQQPADRIKQLRNFKIIKEL
jgi:hypothetical protein